MTVGRNPRHCNLSPALGLLQESQSRRSSIGFLTLLWKHTGNTVQWQSRSRNRYACKCPHSLGGPAATLLALCSQTGQSFHSVEVTDLALCLSLHLVLGCSWLFMYTINGEMCSEVLHTRYNFQSKIGVDSRTASQRLPPWRKEKDIRIRYAFSGPWVGLITGKRFTTVCSVKKVSNYVSISSLFLSFESIHYHQVQNMTQIFLPWQKESAFLPGNHQNLALNRRLIFTTQNIPSKFFTI